MCVHRQAGKVCTEDFVEVVQKELQVGSDSQEQADTVNLFQVRQSTLKPKREQSMLDKKCVFGGCLAAWEAPRRAPSTQRPQSCCAAARFSGRCSSMNILLSSPVCNEYKVK